MNDILHFFTVFSMAARPMLARILEFTSPRAVIPPHREQHNRPASEYGHRAPLDERSELFDEIRRMTAVLEIGRRGMCRDPRRRS